MKNQLKYSLFTALALVVILIMPVIAKAATTAEVQAQIKSLLQQIEVLQQQLAQLQAPGQSGTTQWCHTFNTNLKIGDRGDEISALQTALEKEGLYSQGEANGGFSTHSTIFDEEVAAAVTGFQEKYKDEILTPNGLSHGTGFVGKLTRAKLNKLYGCGVTLPPPTQLSITVLSPNGGEVWTKGTLQTIKWSSPISVIGTYADITLTNWISPCDTKTQPCPRQPVGLYTLAKQVPSGNQSYSWKVGFDASGNDIPAGQYVVRITDSTYGDDQSDAPFSIVVATGSKNVNISDYITQSTPGFRMCLPDKSICIDGYTDSYGEWLIGYTHGIRDYMLRDSTSLYLFGVNKNLDSGKWRCFANPGEQCGATTHYPPQAVPITMNLPIISGTTISNNAITKNAVLIPEYSTWRKFDVRSLDPNTCAQPNLLGSTWHRVHAFIADTIDFGGDLGTQNNVLIIEEETSSVNPDNGSNGGMRLERYYYVNGFGRVREMGAENPSCRANPNASTCNGSYQPQNDSIFNTKVSGDYTINSICPFSYSTTNTNAAQFVSQSAPTVMETGKPYQVSVTMKNTGASAWTKDGQYKLGSQNPQDNTNWGLGRVELALDESIAPGQQKVFTFNVNAPVAAGTYNFQWRMLRENVEWFGDLTPNMAVAVSDTTGIGGRCSALLPFNNTASDASGVIQNCIDQTATGGTLELPSGVYTVARQISINRPLLMKTQGKSSSDPKCDLTNTNGCTEIKASPGFNSGTSVLIVTGLATGTTIDHLIINGNRIQRIGSPADSACRPNNTWGGNNFISELSNFTFTNSISEYALCGTGLAQGPASNVRISNNIVAYNGVHDQSGLWSDGLTIFSLDNSVITDNEFIDNTDVDLIFGGCRNCVIQRNIIRHTGSFQGSSFAAFMIHAWSNTPGDYTGSDISANQIDCGAARGCGFGFLIGGDPWYSVNVYGGVHHDNSIINAQQGFAISHAHDLSISNNTVLNSGGEFNASCGIRTATARSISPTSQNIDMSKDAPAVSYASINWTGCILNWWNLPPASTNKAQFISQSVPATMTAGQSYSVSVTMKNTGASIWTRASNYRIGSQNPQDNLIWNIGRVELTADESIASGQQKVFTFNVNAPAAAGTYNFQWRMLRELVEWFGDFTPNVVVNVSSTVSSSIPTTLRGFVNNMYTCVLGRSPEEPAFTNWTNALASNSISFEGVYNGFFFSQEYISKATTNTVYATQLYECVLFREPTSSEVTTNWVNPLDSNSITRTQALNGFLVSTEFLSSIKPKLQALISQTSAVAPSGQYTASILESMKITLDKIQKAINDLYR